MGLSEVMTEPWDVLRHGWWTAVVLARVRIDEWVVELLETDG
jgi:hypothetical protein